jgi:hypothetical protein
MGQDISMPREGAMLERTKMQNNEHDPNEYDPNAAINSEVRRIMQLEAGRVIEEVCKMAANWIVEHGSDLGGDDGISGAQTIALAYRAKLIAIQRE